MKEELNQFERTKFGTLFLDPMIGKPLGTKWIFRNKLDESRNVIRNKARLVTQGYTQIKSIDFEEIFAPVLQLEVIRMTLAFASFKDFKLFQIDVKSACLNGFIEESVYVEQSSGFVDPTHPNFVFKLDKVLYGLKQAPRD